MAANQYVETYRQLSQAVHDAGLIRRCYGFYGAMIIGWLLALAALWVAVVLLSDAWYQLIIAALIGLVHPNTAGQPLLTSTILSGAAEKFDFLLHPPAAGKYSITVDFLHWVTGEVQATRTVAVTAS